MRAESPRPDRWRSGDHPTFAAGGLGGSGRLGGWCGVQLGAEVREGLLQGLRVSRFARHGVLRGNTFRCGLRLRCFRCGEGCLLRTWSGVNDGHLHLAAGRTGSRRVVQACATEAFVFSGPEIDRARPGACARVPLAPARWIFSLRPRWCEGYPRSRRRDAKVLLASARCARWVLSPRPPRGEGCGRSRRRGAKVLLAPARCARWLLSRRPAWGAGCPRSRCGGAKVLLAPARSARWVRSPRPPWGAGCPRSRRGGAKVPLASTG